MRSSAATPLVDNLAPYFLVPLGESDAFCRVSAVRVCSLVRTHTQHRQNIHTHAHTHIHYTPCLLAKWGEELCACTFVSVCVSACVWKESGAYSTNQHHNIPFLWRIIQRSVVSLEARASLELLRLLLSTSLQRSLLYSLRERKVNCVLIRE